MPTHYTPVASAFRETQAQDRALEPRPFWQRHIVLLLIGVFAIAIAVALAPVLAKVAGVQASVAASRLNIATVERGPFVRDFAADGKVVAAGSPMLYAPSAGTVILRVKPGDAVQRDQVVAVIDSPDLTARLSQERATLQSLQLDLRRASLEAEHLAADASEALAQAKVDRISAQREFDRTQKAYEAGAYAELQLRRVEDALEKASFHLEHTERALATRREQGTFEVRSRQSLLERQQFLVADLARQVAALALRAPADGQVGQVQVNDHANVPRDAPLLSVIDLSHLEVEVQVPESLARDLAPGMTAELTGNGRAWEGTVGGVSPEVVDGQVIARVRFAEDKPQGLRQNQRLTVRVLIENRENVLTIERGSSLDEGRANAYRVRSGVAQKTPVRLGAVSMSRVEILDGLNVGDRVVIAGAEVFDSAERVALSQ